MSTFEQLKQALIAELQEAGHSVRFSLHEQKTGRVIPVDGDDHCNLCINESCYVGLDGRHGRLLIMSPAAISLHPMEMPDFDPMTEIAKHLSLS